ncbi:transposase-like protein [Dyella japonica]|uniref:Transposase-like protein n=1 Tax=Dyella japonica TaxID=231455 RepID=A0ABV2K3T1_9GAMM
MQEQIHLRARTVRRLNSAEGGRHVKEVCRELGIAEATCYALKFKHGGMQASGVQRLRRIEAGHAKLKRMYAELAMENHALKDLIPKTLSTRRISAPLPRLMSQHGWSQCRACMAIGMSRSMVRYRRRADRDDEVIAPLSS